MGVLNKHLLLLHRLPESAEKNTEKLLLAWRRRIASSEL